MLLQMIKRDSHHLHEKSVFNLEITKHINFEDNDDLVSGIKHCYTEAIAGIYPECKVEFLHWYCPCKNNSMIKKSIFEFNFSCEEHYNIGYFVRVTGSLV